MIRFRVVGARSSAREVQELLERIQGFARAHGGTAQLLDASAVFGPAHLASAYEHAARSHARGEATAESLGVEFLRYAAGERRIDRAIEVVGARRNSPLAVALFGDVPVAAALRSAGLVRDDRVLSPRGKSLGRLGISDAEAATVPRSRAAELVLERIALADLAK